MHYIRKNQPTLQQDERCSCWESIKEFFAEIFIYAILGIVLASSVGIYIYGGAIAVVLLIPFMVIIYYYVFHRQKTKIQAHHLRHFDLKQTQQLQVFLKKLSTRPMLDLELLRIPLIQYSNVISERYALEHLDDVVVNLNRTIKDNSFDLTHIPMEMMDDIHSVRTEYLFQGIKLPESYMILLSPSPLTISKIELAIQYIFQTIAKYEDYSIEREDQYLATLLNKQF